MTSILAYKVAVLVLLAVAGGSTGTVWYYYQGKTNNLTGQVSNLNDRTNFQNDQINSL